MPKFVGSSARSESVRIEDDAIRPELVRLSYSQQRLLPAEDVMYSLDTSDRGGPRSYAKRWYRWFATPGAILSAEKSSNLMRLRAEKKAR